MLFVFDKDGSGSLSMNSLDQFRVVVLKLVDVCMRILDIVLHRLLQAHLPLFWILVYPRLF